MQRHKFPLIRWIAIFLVVITVTLITIQLVSYSRIRSNFPLGLKVGDIPISGLNYEEAAERIYTSYRSPIELVYSGARIQVRPAVLGFEPQVENMLAVADKERVTDPFWSGFWDFLWNRNIEEVNIPLNADYNEAQIREYLVNEIAARYDTPAASPKPIPGSTDFAVGAPGTELDLDRATMQVINALTSPTERIVSLSLKQSSVPRPSLTDLEVLLKQIINVSGFDGIVELYMQDLETSRNIHFAYQSTDGDLTPNIAFSAWSTIKIPVMVTAFRYLDDSPPQHYLDLMEGMIEQSENTSTDELAMTVIDSNLSPLIVTETMQTLGLENTFWAGHFYIGAPILQRFDTPANTREDINTEPDIYDQTSPADMGMLMEDIYQCAEVGGGALIAAFPDEITQQECDLMVTFMARNQIAVLIQAGVPSGTTVAHKHGWATEDDDGLMHTMGDVALVYTPGGNYALSIFVHHPVQTLFDPANELFSELSKATYNYFNNQTVE